MAQESKKLIVKRLGTPGTVDVDLLPWATAGDVLRKIGGGPAMVLSPDLQRSMAFDPDEELWNQVQHGQRLYVVLDKYPC